MEPKVISLLIEIAPSLAKHVDKLRRSDKDGLVMLALIYQRLDDMNTKLDVLVQALPKLLEAH